eukprot:snap_masked-scaffold_9-processed-gene-8.23-mRNA-1 protein AED:1.00 eAED:1.00 QI:0/-1/0/0/-1/1/1/0/101
MFRNHMFEIEGPTGSWLSPQTMCESYWKRYMAFVDSPGSTFYRVCSFFADITFLVALCVKPVQRRLSNPFLGQNLDIRSLNLFCRDVCEIGEGLLGLILNL